jgi:hypothetical protein
MAGWPSPNAHDGRRPGADLKSTQGANLNRDVHGIRVQLSNAETESTAGYRLNPYFSAWLMGFPSSWLTALRNLDFRSRKKKP